MKLLGSVILVLLLSSCAMLREGNTETTPNPKEYPCGPKGMVCTDTTPHTCCTVGVCSDSPTLGKGCKETVPSDPSDPTMLAHSNWSKRTPIN